MTSTPLWGVTLPCQRGPAGEGSLHGLAVVSGSSRTHLQRLRVQLLLRERGEEMTFTQLSREQQETLTVPPFPTPGIRSSGTFLTNCQCFCQGLAAANILLKYVDDSWGSGVR